MPSQKAVQEAMAGRKGQLLKAAPKVRHEHTILVLQGGGALGAYQAGVYEGMHERGFAPDWVTGVSIGAINAALIAGNPREKRIERLVAFWDLVSSGIPLIPPAYLDPLRLAFNRVSAMATTAFGVPGFFVPRVPPPYLAPEGTPAALSVYDSSPLRATLEELVDFDLINRKTVRLSMGAVDVHTGNSVYFDNQRQAIGPEHIMASGALPPGLPPVVIDGRHYWDGGIVSNSPLWYVLDDAPGLSALIVQVDLFSARGDLPNNLDQVLERSKDIQYSSKTRFNTTRVKELEDMRAALARFLRKVPARLRDDGDFRMLAPLCERKPRIAVVHLINRRLQHASSAKDYEFSRATVRQRWEGGRDDVRRTCTNPSWRHATQTVDGVRVFDLTG
jgi:NTE family protein